VISSRIVRHARTIADVGKKRHAEFQKETDY
jgi:hypothetical protein